MPKPIVVHIQGNTDNFDKAISSSLKNLAKFTAGMLGLGTIGSVLKDIATEAIKDETATYALASSIKVLKGGTEEAFIAQVKWAEKMSQITGESLPDMKNQLALLNRFTGDSVTSQKAYLVALNVSKTGLMDMHTAIKLMGETMTGHTALWTRYGVTLDKTATAQQNLNTLMNKFGGAEDSYLQTTAGKIGKAQNALKLLEDEIGTAFLPAMGDAATAVTKFLKSFTPEGKEDAIKNQIRALEDSKSMLESGMDYYKRFGGTTADTAKKEKDLQEKIDKVNKSLEEQKKKLKEFGPDMFDKQLKKVYAHAAPGSDQPGPDGSTPDAKKDAVLDTTKMFKDLSEVSKTGNKNLFEIGKAASIGTIVASTAEAVMKTYAEVPTPLNIPAAAAAAIAGGVQLAAAQGAQFKAAKGFYNDTSESMVGQFQPQEVVIPQRFSDLIASGRVSLHGSNDNSAHGGDTINIQGGNKTVEQILLEVKTHLNNKRGGRMVRTDGTPNW